MRSPVCFIAALPVLLGATLSVLPQPQEPVVGVRARFLEQCASCHGEQGDGQGTTELPRPARSFLDGGFSYGNTRTAILRVITHGIPGTPMPSFVDALTLAEREELVEYVIGLGPEREEVLPGETVLVVDDRPQIVRGALPPLIEGAPAFPRGILIGTTTGTTFQYRVDDVRLLGVRQGEFVERADWTDRGGKPLKPLGTPTFLCEAGDPGPTFRLEGGEELVARLKGSWIENGRAGITYQLSRADGSLVATVRESPRSVVTEYGPGFERRFEIEPGPAPVVLKASAVYANILDLGRPIPFLSVFGYSDTPSENGREVYSSTGAWKQTDGRYQMGLCSGPRDVSLEFNGVRIESRPGSQLSFRLTLISSVDAETASSTGFELDK